MRFDFSKIVVAADELFSRTSCYCCPSQTAVEIVDYAAAASAAAARTAVAVGQLVWLAGGW